MSPKEESKKNIHPQPDDEKGMMNRRHFLKASAAAGIGALSLSSLGCADEAAEAQAQLVTAVETDTASSATSLSPPALQTENLSGIKENWAEPMTWRVGDWPRQQLDLNAVYHSAALAVLGFGPGNPNPNANPDGTDLIFSFNGIAPGPTVRMRGDETFYLKLRNLLPLNAGQTAVPRLDPNNPPNFTKQTVADWCLGEHLNGIHATHTTNIHTHGLHVRPGRNPNGTHSDNIFLRVMPQADWKKREASDDPNCNFLKPMETVAQADYEFRLGDVGARFLQDNPELAQKLGHDPSNGPYPHPDGTFWYHPHTHGATFWQVAGGMAGFLLVEGATDDAIKRALCSDCTPEEFDPALPAGPYSYRERVMFLQRIKLSKGSDPDAPKLGNRSVNNTAFAPLVNGSTQRLNITMTPGTVERWRILNGSVDSYGYVRIFVLPGDWQTIADSSSPFFGQLTEDGTHPVPDELLEEIALDYKLLAFDGVTLVNDPTNSYDNPISNDQSGMDRVRYTFQNIAGPEAVLLAVANRADILFQAPVLQTAGQDDAYTVVARNWGYVSDRIATRICGLKEGDSLPAASMPPDTVLARLVVKDPGNAGNPPAEDPFQLIFDELAPDKTPVQPYLHPVLDEELELTDAEKANRFIEGSPLTGQWYRKRLITYSGWGGGYPYDNNKQESKVQRDLQDEYPVDAMNTTTGDTMAIDGFKFDPNLVVHTMNRDTAEEWVLQNCSMTLFGVPGSDDPSIDPRVWRPLPPDQQSKEKEDFGFPDEDGEELFPVSAAVDHPFHIHQNPMWVTERWFPVEVDTETGELLLIKDERWKPRWQDVIHIPRNGGRIVCRSRFWDFLGTYVNHCHLLLHEDNGMMQPIEVIEEGGPLTVAQSRGQINYRANGSIESMAGLLANYAIVQVDGLTDSDVNRDKAFWFSEEEDIWPPVRDRKACFEQSQTAVDTSALPHNPVCVWNPGTPLIPRSQGMGTLSDFCAPPPTHNS